MKNSNGRGNNRTLIVLCAALIILASFPFLSHARAVTTSVNIVNNSSRSVRNAYLSHVNTDDWSGNQLGNTAISPSQSFTLDNVVCDGQQVKVIAEDQDGCFLSTVVNCGDAATWTITDDTTRDCGN
jgi:hypothetical protein